MFYIKKARMKDLPFIRHIIKIFNSKKSRVYSIYKGSITLLLLKGKIYIIDSNKGVAGIFIIDNDKKEISYIPKSDNQISFFRILYIIEKKLGLCGYTLSVDYKGEAIREYLKYFNIEVIKDVKVMQLNFNSYDIKNFKIPDNIIIKRMKLGEEEPLRVELQNQIFSHIKNRKNITINQVLAEEKNPDFIEDMCFILYVNKTPSGYGQILISNNKFYLVNFGVIPKLRGMNYGLYFIYSIFKLCIESDIKSLYLAVDNSNFSAIELYKRVGFIENQNSAIIRFRNKKEA